MANENMDMKRMQEEAIHRVQEMQNRANQQLRGTPSFAASPRTNRSNNGPSFSSGTHGNHTEEPAHHTPNEQGGPLHGHNGGSLPSAPPVSAGPQNIVENLLDGGWYCLTNKPTPVLFSRCYTYCSNAHNDKRRYLMITFRYLALLYIWTRL